MPNDTYILALCPTAGGDLDLSALRCCAVADAHARFQRASGREVLFTPGLDAGVAHPPFDALAISFDREPIPAVGDPIITRWAKWLIEQLDAAQAIYQRSGEGWRLHTGKLHAENERRLGELSGWTEAALADQRQQLEHVEDPGDSGSELEQSLSKLAAAGWKVDSKKDSGPPATHYAAGDLPLASGEDWRAAGAVHPRLAAALAFFLAAVPVDERADAEPGQTALPTGPLPATVVAGDAAAAALLDIRTVAKALRDAGGLDLPSGEPLGTVLATGPLKLRADAPSNGHDPTHQDDAGALIAERGSDAIRVALLHSAAPTKRFRGGDDVIGYADAFLADARELATARFDGGASGTRIDPDDGLRRRLAGWCDTAVARTAENYERLDLHRATRNAIALLDRIKDFDARVTEQRGEVAGADREAVAVALTVLAQLLAPLAPATAEELWGQAGRPGTAAAAGWPSAQGQPAAA